MTTHNFDVNIHLPKSNQKVIINQEYIQVNQKKIFCNEIEAIKYGVSLIGKKKKNQRKDYKIDVKSKAEEISISFSSSKIQDVLEEDHTYYYIMSGLWQYAKKHLINKLIHKLNNKESFTVGNIEITSLGFNIPYKNWFFGKELIGFLLWENSNYFLDKGILYINSTNDNRLKAKLSIHHDWNAVVLNTLLHYLWQENRKEKLGNGEAI